MSGRRAGARTGAGRVALGAAALVVLAATPACDWRDFDSLKNQTPVAKTGAPAGYPVPQDFGGVLLPVSPPADGSAAARYLVAATGQTGLAAISFDARGVASGAAITGGALDALAGEPIWSMAEVKTARKALLGAPGGLSGSLLLVDLDPPYAVAPFFAASEPQLGAGVAAGPLGGGAADDLVALSSTTLHVFVDGQTAGTNAYYTDPGTASACPIFLSGGLVPRYRTNRAVLIADLLGAGSRQLAVGTPSAAGAGAVAIFTVDTTAGAAACALTLTAPGGENAFGAALAAGDFDGDGVPDLLVGAPPTHAYLYRGPLSSATSPATLSGTGGLSYGAAVAAMDLDGIKGDEALIADPDATVAGQMTAGSVSIRTGPSLGTVVAPTPAVTVLADQSPSSGEEYGSVVAALPFCTTASPPADGGGPPDAGADASALQSCTPVLIPLVGASAHVFTYFALGPFDPRAK